MGTLIDKLQTIKSAKDDIKNAIVAKGGSVSGGIGSYASAIANLPAGEGGGDVPELWLECTDKTVTAVPAAIKEKLGVATGLIECFSGCSQLTEVTLSDLSNLKYMDRCFYSCSKLYDVFMHGTFPNVVSMSYCFYNCTSVRSLSLNKCKNITNLDYCFAYCRGGAFASVDLGDKPYLRTMAGMCISSGAGSFMLSSAPNLTNMNYSFQDCNRITEVTLPSLPRLKSMSSCFSGSGNPGILMSLEIPSAPLVTNMQYCFCNACISSIKMSDMTSIKNMYRCFNNCSRLTDLTLPSSLSNVTNMDGCFENCTMIKSINLPTKLGSLSTMSSCFSQCRALTCIDLEEFGYVSNMSTCFCDCYNLTSVNVRSNGYINNMYKCFQNCSKIESISLPNVFKVTSFYGCFSYCSSLQNLTMGKMNTALSDLSTCGLSYCTKLTVDSLVNVLNALPTRTGTNRLTIGTTNLNKLTSTQKAIATGKGWTLN